MSRLRLLSVGCSNYTPLQRALQACASAELTLECTAAPFGQVFPTLLDDAAPCWQPRPDVTLVWTRPERVLPTFERLLAGEDVDDAALEHEVDAFVSAVLAGAARTQRVTLVTTWALTPEQRGLGATDWSSPNGIGPTLARLNLRLAAALANRSDVLLLDAQRWVAAAGARASDAKLWLMGKIPYGAAVFAEAVLDIQAAVAGVLGHARKLLVLDLDHTLWGGIVGDDGWENLQLGSTSPVGEAYVAFQRALRVLQRRGVVLALCSKNEESVALEAIDRHPEMVLRRDDFVAWRINWHDKATNLRQIVEELNLGLNATVFIDDSPAERGRVREVLPEVLVPEWPSDPSRYVAALQRLRCFDRPRMTDEDRQRTQSYVAERYRREIAQATESLDEWLQRLELAVQASPLTPADLPRAVQLLNKTNQFNLVTRRLGEAEFRAFAAEPQNRAFTYRVRDRFGDYGLTALATLTLADERATLVDFVMSCRVMGRRVEHTIMRHIESVVRAAGCTTLAGRYLPTPRNQPCAGFLGDCGFESVGDGEWRKPLSLDTPPSTVTLQLVETG